MSAFLKPPLMPLKQNNAEVYGRVAKLDAASIKIHDRVPDDMLFHMFYAMPQQEAQKNAANALTMRGWLYHTEMQTWMRRCTDADPPTLLQEGCERGSWLFFDIKAWQVKRRDNIVINTSAIIPKSH